MPKQTLQAVAAGAGFTSIRASIPAHYMEIFQDGATPTIAIKYRLPDDNFTAVYTMAAGQKIRLWGDGEAGILGKPPNYVASGDPALGDVVIQIGDAAGGAGYNAVVKEVESAGRQPSAG